MSNNSNGSFPRWTLSFLHWFCPASLYEGIEGDLLESFESDVRQYGLRHARRRMVWNTLRFFRLEILLRNKFSPQLINTIMIGNYLKVASRNILKRKLYSFINAFGLSIGLAFCILIYLFISDEKSFDQFHANKERIYRLHATNFNEEAYSKGEKDFFSSHAYLPAKLGEVVRDELAEVEHMSRFNSGHDVVMRVDDKIFKESVAFIDSGFFKMFSFRVIAGNSAKFLSASNELVITPEVATRYFGKEDPIGRDVSIEINGQQKPFVIAGVIDKAPGNSSLDYNILISTEASPWYVRNREQWGAFSWPTFVQLRPRTDVMQFKTHLDTLMQKYMGARMKQWRERSKIPGQYKVAEFNFEPVTQIHFSKISWERTSDPKYSWILGGIALLIIVIACINYISLALTSSAARRVEVGVRKVVGALRSQLVYQFGLESLLLAFLSMVIGVGMAVLFLPAFNSFTGKSIQITTTNTFQLLGISVLISLSVGILAGSYPALFLSRFLPASVLKGKFTSKLSAGFTKPLVVFQFFISASLIICSVIMMRQMNFITAKDLGYNKEQVIAIETQSGWTEEADKAVDRFRNHLQGSNAVIGIAGTSSSFNQGWSRYGYRVKDENKSAYVYRVDTEYIPLMGLELVAGRNFDPNIISDSSAIIVNEALVKDMGWKNPLEENLNWREDSVGPGSRVIGVVKDYHFLSLEQSIEPLFLSLDKRNVGYLTTMLVKLAPNNIPENLETVKKAWIALFPDKPFAFTFVDEDVARQYASYKRWMNITALATGFAIVIACLGLFGLAGINALNRTKEIGIRKVMGAELKSIFFLLNRQYFVLAIIAFALAAPVSWYVMNKWLASFTFKIAMGWELFAVSMLIGLSIAIFTVSYHAIKAALINPAETLKYE
jgi:putative ABC transport system permease protein